MRIRRHYQLTILGLLLAGWLHAADINYCAPGYMVIGINDNVALVCVQHQCSSLTDAAASCSTDTTNAGNISSGTLNAGRLPTPGATTLGGVKSLTCTGTDKLSAIGTDGLPVCSADSAGSGLPSDPSACPANQWVTDQNASGVLTCSQPAFTNISGSVTDAQVPDNITITALASKTLLVGSASLDCPDPSASSCSSCGTITVTGAAVGDPVIIGVPGITLGTTQTIPTARVTATNTVTVQICEGSTVTNNPAAGTFTAIVIH